MVCSTLYASALRPSARCACAVQYRAYSRSSVSFCALISHPRPCAVRFFEYSSYPRASAARAPQMFVVFLAAKAESFSYAPGVALWSARARSESSFSAASSCGVSATTWGTDVSGLHPVRQGGDLGFFDLRWCLDDCATASSAPPNDNPKISIHAAKVRDIEKQNNTAFEESLQKCAACVRLVMAGGRGVRVVTEGVRVPFGEDFHHPAIKVIHRVVHDWFEAAVVFSMSFFNVVFQSDAEISVFAAEAHLLPAEHLYVLHPNFCYAIFAAVQFLFFSRKPGYVQFIAALRVHS